MIRGRRKRSAGCFAPRYWVTRRGNRREYSACDVKAKYSVLGKQSAVVRARAYSRGVNWTYVRNSRSTNLVACRRERLINTEETDRRVFARGDERNTLPEGSGGARYEGERQSSKFSALFSPSFSLSLVSSYLRVKREQARVIERGK